MLMFQIVMFQINGKQFLVSLIQDSALWMVSRELKL